MSGEFGHVNGFDSGFQTRPILPFDEEIKNAWEDQEINFDDQRKVVKPMPPVSNITISHPEWVKEDPSYQEEVNMFCNLIRHTLGYLIYNIYIDIGKARTTL